MPGQILLSVKELIKMGFGAIGLVFLCFTNEKSLLESNL